MRTTDVLVSLVCLVGSACSSSEAPADRRSERDAGRGAPRDAGGIGRRDAGAPPEPADAGVAVLDAPRVADAAGPGPDAPRAPDAGAGSCTAPLPLPDLSTSVTLSAGSARAVLPSVAARAEGVVVAWQEFGATTDTIRFVRLRNGCAGPVQELADDRPDRRRPRVVATASGYAIAYQARQGDTSRARLAHLTADGTFDRGETISTDRAFNVEIAAWGDDVVLAWTDGERHHFARRGPIETVSDEVVPTELSSLSLANYPRVAVTSDGTLYLAYRDGGTEPTDWDVLLLTRPRGSRFSAPRNLSVTPGRVSDELAVAATADGALEVVWTEQGGDATNTFEIHHARRHATGLLSVPRPLATLGGWSWRPAVVPGPSVLWYERQGSAEPGHLYLSIDAGPASRILGAQIGGDVALAQQGGTLHVVFRDAATPARIHYAALQR